VIDLDERDRQSRDNPETKIVLFARFWEMFLVSKNAGQRERTLRANKGSRRTGYSSPNTTGERTTRANASGEQGFASYRLQLAATTAQRRTTPRVVLVRVLPRGQFVSWVILIRWTLRKISAVPPHPSPIFWLEKNSCWSLTSRMIGFVYGQIFSQGCGPRSAEKVF
jgi:hypothetical protein